MSVNRARGEVAFTLDGRELRLCLTLGALAEIEALPAAPVTTEYLITLVEILLRAGGHPLTRDELRGAGLDAARLAELIVECFMCE